MSASAAAGSRTAVGTGAYDGLRRTVLARIESERLDPDTDLPAVRAAVVDAVEAYQRQAHLGEGVALRDPAEMATRLLRSITAFGPLTDLLSRPDVEEVFLEGPRVSYIDGTGRLQGLAAPTTEEENRQVVDRLLSTTQRHLDARSPLVQARVLNGRARLTAAIPPIGDALSATIRRSTLRRDTLGSLLEKGSLTPPAAGLLWAAMQTSTSLLVSGPPGAGKTSLLSALIAAAPSNHCVRCCEEIRELHVPLTHGSFYEARPPAMDGSGEVTLRDLVKFVLAMRPDHIVVGEVRGAEAFELTRAVNAGCGFACTVHANSARDALSALVNAAIMAGENVPEPVVRAVFARAIDFVVHLDLDDVNSVDPAEGLRRQVCEIVAVVPSLHDDFSTEPVFVRERVGAPLEWTGVVPPGAELLERCLPDGLTLRAILEGRRVPL
ncbi:MAG TPA: ATPase, T2SS/T4P/T4SS family [Egibacteraceae bacterium]|nr:ATPase, T2SS/T4P/T4SS family [Egibacteraceae bacterium]